MEKIEKSKEFISSIPNRIISVVGATSSILIIFLIAYLLKLIPLGVSISVGLFISLPLAFSFVFGVLTNNPNFGSTIRNYGFWGYLFFILILYFIYMRPDSFMLLGKYICQFFLGLFLTIFAGGFYLIPNNLLKKYQYRIKHQFLLEYL